MAALWPERCRAMVSVSGYLIGSQATGEAPLPPAAEQAWWYQYYFATKRGRAVAVVIHNYRSDAVAEVEFERAARGLTSAARVPTSVIHACRPVSTRV